MGGTIGAGSCAGQTSRVDSIAGSFNSSNILTNTTKKKKKIRKFLGKCKGR